MDIDATDAIDRRIAQRLKALRAERGWSLDELARLSKVSRSTLSRLENAEVSPTAAVLARLCATFDVALSRLMHLVEDDFAPYLCRRDQPLWTDPETGFRRRSVSPPAPHFAGEVLECELKPGTRFTYENPPRRGMEHHLLLLSGKLAVTLEGQTHELRPGDCLRYRLHGASAIATPKDSPARYLILLVQ